MSEQSFNQHLEDIISFKDSIDFLSESWKAIVLSGIVGGLLASGYVFNISPKYQATANIQVTKVAGSDVEAPSILLEKLKMPPYYSTESYSACKVMDSIEPGEVIAKSLKPTLSKNSPIISFSYTAESSDEAIKCLESILNDVRSNQNLLAKPILESKKNQLMNLRKKLDTAERVLKILPTENQNFEFSDSKFSVASLLLVATLNQKNEIYDLSGQINDLEIALMEPSTREAFLIMPIYAPKQKVSPNTASTLIKGLLSGLFFGLLFQIIKRSWHIYKAKNQ
jgi:uncharacterized protein involved in exopolysaccharide biosynthesis